MHICPASSFPIHSWESTKPTLSVNYSTSLHPQPAQTQILSALNQISWSFLCLSSYTCLRFWHFRWDAFFRLAIASAESPRLPRQRLTFYTTHLLLKDTLLSNIFCSFFPKVDLLNSPSSGPIVNSTYCIHKLLQSSSTFITAALWLPAHPTSCTHCLDLFFRES